MRRSFLAQIPSVSLAPALFAAAALLLWFIAARGSGGAAPGATALPLAGWILTLLPLLTVAAVVQTACSADVSEIDPGSARPMSPGGRATLGFAVLGDMAALLLALVAVGWGRVRWTDAAALFLVILSWTSFWALVAWLLRRWGPAISIGLPLALAMLAMAAPVIFAPVVRAAQGSRVPFANAVGLLCPFFGLLDAARPSLRVDWATLPGMYDLSGLGQEFPMALPAWWAPTLVYGLLAILLTAVATVLAARRRED